MGEKNDVFCAWLEKAKIFSDFMNGAMFAGKQKILSRELEPVRRDYHEKERKRGEVLLDGEKRLADLVSMLLATGRVEDIRKAMDNSEFRRELYRECGIDGGSRE